MAVHHSAWHCLIASLYAWWFCLRPIEPRRLDLGLDCEGIVTVNKGLCPEGAQTWRGQLTHQKTHGGVLVVEMSGRSDSLCAVNWCGPTLIN